MEFAALRSVIRPAEQRALSTFAEATEPEMAAPAFLNRYASVARKLGLRTFVNGVNTQAMAKLCRQASIVYLGGRRSPSCRTRSGRCR